MHARLLLLVIGVGLSSACSCGGAIFSHNDAAKICETVQVCSPTDFRNYFGGDLSRCTTLSSLPIPLPGTLEKNPGLATGLEEPMRDVYQCILDAHGDCGRANSCWSQGQSGGSCQATSAGLASGTCDGDKLSGCTADGQKFFTDCAHYGEKCSSVSFFFASYNTCALGVCSSTADDHCDGNTAVTCAGSSTFRTDCTRLGGSCLHDPDGGIDCQSGKSCDPQNASSTCDGNVAVQCSPNGFEQRIDCTKNPTLQRCDKGACVPTGNQCRIEDGASCDGARVKFCQDGYNALFDCEGNGFLACDNGACRAK